MAFSPVDVYDAKAQTEADRSRSDRKVQMQMQKAAVAAASSSRKPSSLPSSSLARSSAQYSTLEVRPSSSSQPRASSSSSAKFQQQQRAPAWRRPTPAHQSSSYVRRRDALLEQEVAELEYGHPDEVSSDDDDLISEPDHDDDADSSMYTWPVSVRGEYPLPSSLVAIIFPDQNLTSPISLSRNTDAASLTRNTLSPSASKLSTPLASAAAALSLNDDDSSIDGPGLGLLPSSWRESEPEDGCACWTAYASEDRASSVIVVRECRW